MINVRCSRYFSQTFQEAGFTVKGAALRWLPSNTMEVTDSQHKRSPLPTIDTLPVISYLFTAHCTLFIVHCSLILEVDDVQNVTAKE